MKRTAATILVSEADDHSLQHGRGIIRHEAEALLRVAEALDHRFVQAVDLILDCRGSILVCGMGKAGLIGQKIAATFASTGTRSHFLHPAEARHGDLGRLHRDDVVLILSNSGQTEEIVDLLPSIREVSVSTIAVTQRRDSAVGRHATIILPLDRLKEADGMNLAPSTSTTAMLAMGDALALVVSQRRGFQAKDFARFHPGGSLGRKLARVDDVMRPLCECRLAQDHQTIRHVLVHVGRPGRRTGAIMLVDKEGRLTGIFTDSDLARLFESRRDSALDEPIQRVMNADPTRVNSGEMASAAIELLAENKISELPVVDQQGRPLGMIDITDVVGWSPEDDQENGSVLADMENDSPPTIPFQQL